MLIRFFIERKLYNFDFRICHEIENYFVSQNVIHWWTINVQKWILKWERKDRDVSILEHFSDNLILSPFCQGLWRNQSFRRIDLGNPRLLNSIREIFGNPSGLRYTYLFAVGLNHHRNRTSVISLQLLSSKLFPDIIGSSGFYNALTDGFKTR